MGQPQIDDLEGIAARAEEADDVGGRAPGFLPGSPIRETDVDTAASVIMYAAPSIRNMNLVSIQRPVLPAPDVDTAASVTPFRRNNNLVAIRSPLSRAPSPGRLARLVSVRGAVSLRSSALLDVPPSMSASAPGSTPSAGLERGQVSYPTISGYFPDNFWADKLTPAIIST